MWTAWNEPNNPIWLTPQYKRVGKTWRVESAFNYAKICNAVYNGRALAVSSGRCRTSRSRAASPARRGTTRRRRAAPSVDPLTFLTQAQQFGMKDFDVYAHHPYADIGSGVADVRAEGQDKRRRPARQHQLLLEARHAATTGRSTSGSPSTATRRIRPTRRSACRAKQAHT